MKFPLGWRPGPLLGREASESASRRKPVMLVRFVFTTTV
jgi:hypothetical protein